MDDDGPRGDPREPRPTREATETARAAAAEWRRRDEGDALAPRHALTSVPAGDDYGYATDEGVPAEAPDDAVGDAPAEADVAGVVGAPVEAPAWQRIPARRAALARAAGEHARAWGQASGAWLAARTREQWLWAGVLALAAVLRFWELGAKPLHHDESMHAYYSLLFAMDPSSYAYNPLLHGPFQFHAEGLMFAFIILLEHIFRVWSAAGNPWITDATARIVPATFGLGIVTLPLGLRRELGRAGAWIAALILATSPAFVYFSRFLREDIYFNFFMFAMVVCAVRFAHDRRSRWFLGMVLATVLAYATFEGIYLTAAIFGAFLAGLVAWELGSGLARLLPATLTERERHLVGRAVLLTLYACLGGAVALIGRRLIGQLSRYINSQAHAAQSAVQVANLETATVSVLLYFSIVVALVVIAVLVWQLTHEPLEAPEERDLATWEEDHDDFAPPEPRRQEPLDRVIGAVGRAARRVRDRLDPDQQPLLHLLTHIGWVQWFVAFVLAWIVFAALYWIIPGPSSNVTLGEGFVKGVGSGIWQGLYYWLQQQQIARGGQPWYYYLLLIPLYEQLTVALGLVGLVYALVRPTRFRLFVAWWFVASLGLYSWAGEKMPWLSIHILLPLVLLAALALGRLARPCATAARRLGAGGLAALRGLTRAQVSAAAGMLCAILLFIPQVHGMIELAFIEPASGPHEMMIYVQTTNDVDTVMAKINKADHLLYGGKHLLRIGVGQGEEWPFWWYLRDYEMLPHPTTSAYFEYPAGNPSAPQMDVLILLPSDAQTFLALHPHGWSAKEYRLRAWWDEAYKPPPCVATPQSPCPASAQWGSGVGLGLYLSYGSNPPPHARFSAGLAAQRLWSWLWQRKPLGATNGSYDFVFLVRQGVPIRP